MATLKVGKSLTDDDVLWRHIPIEGLINMLDSGTLYFTPLDRYKETDPWEGHIPKVAFDAYLQLVANAREQMIAGIDSIEKRTGAHPKLATLRAEAEQHHSAMTKIFGKVVSCTTVNCWYRSRHESEGMWSLYAKSGVAIRTTVRSIKAAFVEDECERTVHMGSIRYLDFTDPSLASTNCLTPDGHLMGMIKRIAYSHENEVRMFTIGDVDYENLDAAKPKSISIKVDVNRIIEQLYISPFASPSMKNSIRAIAIKYGIPESKIINSTLLDQCAYWLPPSDQ